MIGLGSGDSIKKSAGPPMLNDVCFASGRPSSAPGRPRSQARLLALRQLTGEEADVTGPHEHDQVAGADDLFQPGVDVGSEQITVDGGRERIGISLTSAVDLGDDDGVGRHPGRWKLVAATREAAVAMRLEDEHEPSVFAYQFAGRLQRRGDFDRGVAVIVVQLGTVPGADELEAPMGAPELA